MYLHVDLLIPHHYLLRSGGTVSSTMEVSVYDTRADTINVEDISTDSNSNNQHVLRRLKRNEADDKKTLWIQNEHEDDDDEECTDYVPEGADDMGWLGLFIGKNDHVEELNIRPFTPPLGASVRDSRNRFL